LRGAGRWRSGARIFTGTGLHEAWQNALSDDYVLAHVVKKVQKKKIQFVPSCVVASDANFNWGSLFEFAVRQYRITKVCEPIVWLVAIGGGVLYLSALLYTLTRCVIGFTTQGIVTDRYNQLLMFLVLF